MFDGVEQKDMVGGYDEEGIVSSCGKMVILDKIMRHAKEHGRKVR